MKCMRKLEKNVEYWTPTFHIMYVSAFDFVLNSFSVLVFVFFTITILSFDTLTKREHATFPLYRFKTIAYDVFLPVISFNIETH